MTMIEAGDLRSLCAGWAAGVGLGLSLGWTLGPVGVGVVLIGAAACITADTNK